MLAAKPILVTGLHRSGKTWLARMIAASPAVAYIPEPFNIHHDIGRCGAQIPHYGTGISRETCRLDFYASRRPIKRSPYWFQNYIR
jgi:hypothetical protein